MAEVNIRRWRLSVLRVGLDLTSATPDVAVALVSFEGDQPQELWRATYDPEEFGIPPDGPPTALRLPEDVVSRVASSFSTALLDETALWLRLTPPYGYLGAAPWERELIPVMDRPLLRVPDRLPVAADFGTRWTAVLALSARPGNGWAVDYLAGYLERMHDEVGVPLDVHVFADALTADQLARLGIDAPWWHLHDPRRDLAAMGVHGDLVRHGLPRVFGRPAVWSEWIRGGLEGRAVRALHVVTDAAFDGDRPMLLVPTDPMHPDPARAGFVPVEGALRLSDVIGAATLSFGSPPDNVSDLATRMLADDLGQRRAGPTLYSSLGQDPDGAALARTHAYLADPRRDLPISESQFLYAQPEHCQTSLAQAWPVPPAPSAAATSSGDDVLPSMPQVAAGAPPPMPLPAEPVGDVDLEPLDPLTQEVPAWVAASYRFLGDSWARLARDQGDPAYARGVTEALEDLRTLVDRETP